VCIVLFFLGAVLSVERVGGYGGVLMVTESASRSENYEYGIHLGLILVAGLLVALWIVSYFAKENSLLESIGG